MNSMDPDNLGNAFGSASRDTDSGEDRPSSTVQWSVIDLNEAQRTRKRSPRSRTAGDTFVTLDDLLETDNDDELPDLVYGDESEPALWVKALGWLLLAPMLIVGTTLLLVWILTSLL